ncbi:hypothetical protein HanIR_Chr15g0739921 [Helianthus annuus]|nr:hypothetical protein HanIR_Chr15g0739921 [Helianthus annuus]
MVLLSTSWVLDLLHIPETQLTSKDKRYIVRGIVYTTMWVLWNERSNDRIFNNKRRRPAEIVENVKSTAFFWYRNRSRCKDVDWKNWCVCPLD